MNIKDFRLLPNIFNCPRIDYLFTFPYKQVIERHMRSPNCASLEDHDDAFLNKSLIKSYMTLHN